MADRFVLDTSAIFTLTDYEEGWQEVESLLDRAQTSEAEVGVSSISLMELYYVVLQEVEEDSAARLVTIVKAWPVRWLVPGEEDLLLGGRLKAGFRLSVADALIAATARRHGATLVHKDPEFEALTGEVELLPLPFKGERTGGG